MNFNIFGLEEEKISKMSSSLCVVDFEGKKENKNDTEGKKETDSGWIEKKVKILESKDVENPLSDQMSNKTISLTLTVHVNMKSSSELKKKRKKFQFIWRKKKLLMM